MEDTGAASPGWRPALCCAGSFQVSWTGGRFLQFFRDHVPLKRFLEGIVGHKAYLGASSQPVE